MRVGFPKLALIVLAAVLSQGGFCGPLPPLGLPGFHDDFALARLDTAKWATFRHGDFESESVEVADGRLRLAASTVGTDDRTVKYHGVRSRRPVVDLAAGADVSFDLDWGDQANGCYMTAGVYICPAITSDPQAESDWLRLLYLGVPPGHKGRCLVSVRSGGRDANLLTENWPESRTGRKIAKQRLRLVWEKSKLMVVENDVCLLAVKDLPPSFRRGYLYLLQSSHSNYQMREVFFDNISVRTGRQ